MKLLTYFNNRNTPMNNIKAFRKILSEYRKHSFSERDKGDRFERLIQAYLQTDPQYSNQLAHVWM
jgi:predicted helicase